MASNIVKGAAISYISIFVNILITLVYTPWMIREIGVSDYGLYSLVGFFLSYFLLDFGLSGTITRFVSKYRAEGDDEKIRNLLGVIAKVYLIFDTAIFAILFILYFFIANIFGGLTAEEIERLKILYVIAGTFSVLSFTFTPVSGAMMAYEYYVANKLFDLLIRIGTVFLIVCALIVGGNVFHLVFITGGIGFIVALFRYYYFINKSKIKVNWNYFDKKELIALFSFSVWVLLIQLSQMLRLNLVPTILGMVSNTTEISIFSIGRSLEGFVYTISTALGGLFLPMVSRMVVNNDRKSIMDLMVKVGRFQLFIVTLIFSAFCVYGDSFLYLWVGETFNNSYYVFIFLVCVNIISLTLQIANDLVYAENKIRHTALRVFVSSLIGVLLSVIVAPKYGAIGCAAATGFALVLTQILFVQFFKSKMGLDMGYFFTNCHLKILPPLVLYSVLAAFVRRFYVIDNWGEFCISISFYALVYIFISYWLLMNDAEKKLLTSFMKEHIHRN